MGPSNAPFIMTLVNSIIGVSILAMPFCYKQCGILLASLILIFSNLLTRLSCHYLLKSATMTRRRTFELLAFHALGPAGKTAVELSIILLMIGTCIAFFVVMGDLSPPIIGSLLELKMNSTLRPAVLMGLAIFVVLPLGLLRNVDSLSSICTASFLFYLFLVFKVFIECTNNLFSGSWIDEVHYWKPAGILQCLPIFSMALSCQTQLLEVFDSAANCTVDRMNSIVKTAVNLCTALYISVGFFGYVAYYKQTFSGNLLMSFSESYFSEFIKLGFVLSVAVTFPLVIFPCRASLYSLLFKKGHVPHYELVTGGGNHIPEAQFKCITFFIIFASLIVGLLAPNIEIVLGLLGSTIGVVICILCPPILFICISSKATTEKVLAQFLCALGLFIMVMGTYANVYLSESAASSGYSELENLKTIDGEPVKMGSDALPQLVPDKVAPALEMNNERVQRVAVEKAPKPPPPTPDKRLPANANPGNLARVDKLVESQRVEPPVPMAPLNSGENSAKLDNDAGKRVEPPIPVAPSNDKQTPPRISNVDDDKRSKAPVLAVPVEGGKKNVEKVRGGEMKRVQPVAAVEESQNPNDLRVKSSPSKAALVADQVEEKKAASKSSAEGNQRLSNEQKQALRKMRAKNKEKMAEQMEEQKSDLKNEAPNVVERNARPAVENDNKVDVESKSVKEQAEEKPPLPLLVHGDAKQKQIENESPKRDILEAATVADREKRDLYFVTHARVDDVVNPRLPKADEKSAHGVSTNAQLRSNENPSCEKKNGGGGDSVPVKGRNVSSKISLRSLIPKEASSTANASKLSAGTNGTRTENSGSNADVTEANANAISSNGNVSPMRSSAASSKQSDSILMAPSKLSDPVVPLPEKVSFDDKLKPAVVNALKPMSRELKTINDKPETGDNKEN